MLAPLHRFQGKRNILLTARTLFCTNKISTTGRKTLSTTDASPRRPTFELYNSLTERIQSLDGHNNNNNNGKGVACYTCGPTVYAPTHLGHARTYVCLDILRRVWEHQHSAATDGTTPPPLFVMNITDVDDKILQAAVASDQDPLELARHYEAAFWHDFDRLHCLRPHVVTRVTEHVESHIIPFIQRLVDSGMAYVTEQEGVYFDVQAFEAEHSSSVRTTRYGKLAPSAQATTFFDTAGNNDDDDKNNNNNKKDVRDFALWKLRQHDDKVEALLWQAPWGAGRPGWHIECSAMIQSIQERFGCSFVLHTGGVDLKFPHHTNEIAQSEAYHNKDDDDGEWIPHWVHFGHLHIDGRKMSKSLKNFVTVQEMLQSGSEEGGLASPADDFRLWCLSSSSYRSPVTYSSERLAQAREMRGRIVRFFLTAQDWMQKAEYDDPPNTNKVWNKRDMELFRAAQALSASHVTILLNDLNGAALVQDIMALVEKGVNYMNHTQPADGTTEALGTAMQVLRQILALVGFSNTTVEAGKMTMNASEQSSSRIAGGEAALVDTLVEFREEIRTISLDDMAQGRNSNASQQIIRLCDTLRDKTLPSLGVELMDGKVVAEENEWNRGSAWRFCIPHQGEHLIDQNQTDSSSPRTMTLRLEDLQQIPLEDFFKSSQFEGQFSAFDEDGVPTHATDGTEISKRQRKKLLKKRAIHEKRLKDMEM